MLTKKIKKTLYQKHWGKKCNCFALSYFTFRNLNFKIDRKWRETHFDAHRLKTGWGSRNYRDLQFMSWSKEDITVPSFHTTHTTTEAFPLILKKIY